MRWSSFLPLLVVGTFVSTCIDPTKFPADVFNIDLVEAVSEVPGSDTTIPEDVRDVPDLQFDVEEISDPQDVQPDPGTDLDARDVPSEAVDVATDDGIETDPSSEIVPDTVEAVTDTAEVEAGLPPGCEYNDTDCNDNNPCTDDYWCTDPWPDCFNKPNTDLCGEARCEQGGFLAAVYCAEGLCPAQEWKSCDDGNPCTFDGCDPESDEGCDHVFNVLPCDDGNPCTGDDQCQTGTCAGIVIPCDCSDGDCSEFEDGDLCNGTLFCDVDQHCKLDEATIVTCQELDDPCKALVCQSDTGDCVETGINEGKPCAGSKCDAEGHHATSFCLEGQCPEQVPVACNDSDVCNGVETCNPLEGCQDGTPLDCDDGEVCTVDTCDPVTGCDSSQNYDDYVCAPSYCDFLTFYEEKACESGSCPSHTTQDCNIDDGTGCTFPDCDDQMGCLQANHPDDMECSQAQCEGGDYYPAVNCDGMGTCPDPIPVDCDDGNSCTTDSCDVATGCQHVPTNETQPCLNHLGQEGTCVLGLCQTECATDEDCDDEIDCTADSCDTEAGKCGHTPQDAICDDGNLCTDDSCVVGVGCVYGNNSVVCAPSTCASGDFLPEVNCKDGACPNPVPEDCNDGDVCTGTETCDPLSGCVSGTPLNCDDGEPCNGTEICNPKSGCAAGELLVCDDGDACNGVEFCQVGEGCQEGTAPDCALPDDDICDGVEACDPDIGCFTAQLPLNCDDIQVCTVDVCNPVTGCDNAQNNDGYVCGPSYCDELTFHEEQSCFEGACPAYTTQDCDVDDQNVCTYPACTGAAGCVQKNHPQSLECASAKCENEGFFPAVNCDGAGTCPQQVAVDCDDSNLCTADSCAPEQGCLHVATNEGLDCLTHLGQEGTCVNGECSTECLSDGDCDDEIECTVDSCDMVTGQCDHVPEHGACDDANECTDDSCVAGFGCEHVDNSILCAVAACEEGVFHPEVFCTGGTCPEPVPEDCDDGNLCTDDSCDPSTGCTNAANTSMVCHPGACEALLWYAEVLCNDNGICPDQQFTEDCNDNEDCTVDACDPQEGCDNSQNNEGFVCGPSYCDALTFYEEQTCSGGSCPVYTTQDCDLDDGNVCTHPVCGDGAGCAHANQPDTFECAAARCEEGNFFPATSCDGVGNCSAQVPVECDDGNACTDDSCDPSAGCVHTAMTSMVCHSGYCDFLQWFEAVLCAPDGSCPDQGMTQDCDDGEVCTIDSCDPASGCDNTQNNDGYVCAPSYCEALVFHQEQTCTGGACPAWTTQDCDVDDQNVCTYPACDDQTGCSQENQPADHQCAPAQCISNHFYPAVTCTGTGTCPEQVPEDCDDGNTCTSDTCDTSQGCLHSPTNEGQPCVTHLGQDGKCTEGVCTTECTVDSDCDDEFDCTTDSCNTVLGKCVHVPVHSACDDVNECTDDSCVEGSGCVYGNNTDLCGTSRCEAGDFLPAVYCINGVCPAQVPVDCDDGNPCTDDSCDDSAGCDWVDNTDSCAAAKCEGGSYYPEMFCSGGACPSPVPVSCNDNNVCNGTETCDPSIGCVPGVALDCVDNDPCNGVETCHPTEGCQPGTPLDCDDADVCTGIETCETGTGCLDGTPLVCEDGDVCNGVKDCDPGTGCYMLLLPLDCDDSNPCTVDTCDAVTGCDNSQNNDGYVCGASYCDGLMFHEEKICTDGACPAGSTQDCDVDDQNPCTFPACDDDTGCFQADHPDTESCAAAYCDGLTHYPEVFCDGAGTCPPAAAKVCDDQEVCTVDACNAATGCDYSQNNDGYVCKDAKCQGLWWHPPVECAGGVCPPETAVDCSDGDDCTDDLCDPSLGCVYTALEDLDHDGLCALDSCPTVWNPDNAAGICPDLGSGWPLARTVTLSESGSPSTWRRTNEPVEVPLWNGILDDSVVGYWKLDDGSAKDYGSGGNNGTVNNATPADGAFGDASGALLFNGAVAYVGFGQPADLMLSDQFSISLWMKSTDLSGVLAGWGKSTSMNDYNRGYDLTISGPDGRPCFHLGTADSFATVCSDDSVSDDSWHNIVGVYGFDVASLYVDGRLVIGQTISGPITYAQTLFFEFGRRPYDGRYFDGVLDDVLVLDRSLSPTEIAAYYNSLMPYGTDLVPDSQPDFDDVRVTEVSSQQSQHLIPHDLLGVREHSDTPCPLESDDGTWADRDDLCGVVGYWKLNGNGNDSSGNGLTLTIPDQWTAFTRGRFGASSKALEWTDSGSSEITSPVSPLLKLQEFTIELFALPAPGGEQSFVLKGFWPGSLNYHVYLDSSQVFHCSYTGTDGSVKNCYDLEGEQIPFDRWTHFACVVEQGETTLYVDGLPTETCSWGIVPESGYDHEVKLLNVQVSTKGDDVLIHSIAKSPDYIYRRANPGVPTVRFLAHTESTTATSVYPFLDYALHWGSKPAPLVAPILTALDGITKCHGLLSPCLGYAGWWRFNEGSGIVAVDSSTNRNHGTPLPEDSPPQFKSGLEGTALNFDGIDDHVELPVDVPQVDASGFTVEAGVVLSIQEQYQRVFSRNGNDNGYTLGVFSDLTGSQFSVWDDGSMGLLHAKNLTTYIEDQAYHLAGRLEGDKLSHWTQYVPVETSIPFPDPVFPDSNPQIGCQTTVCNHHFGGVIDSVRLTNRALREDEFLHFPLASWFLEPCDVLGTPDTDCDGGPDITDCEPLNPAVFLGADEDCGNGVDDDCDNTTDCNDTDCNTDISDVGGTGCIYYYYDGDGDSYGKPSSLKCLCAPDPDGGWTANNGFDCDDNAVLINPGASEVCNGVDDNCTGGTDEDTGNLCPTGQTCVDGKCLTDGFVPIPAGAFWMGSPQSSTCPAGYPGVCQDEVSSTYNDDENLHYVKLTRSFEMQEHEVTQHEFTTLIGWNPSHFSSSGNGTDCGANCPVEEVSWYDAVAFANELSLSVSLTPCYVITNPQCEQGGNPTDGSDYLYCMDDAHGGIDSATVTLNNASTLYGCNGYRLPTESEWEYAIRAGSYTAFYPSDGNDGTITYEDCTLDPNLDQIGWYCGNNSPNGTKPVGGKEPNGWGLHDMSGNVWEWVWDEYVAYPGGTWSSPIVDPVGGASGSKRGGSWHGSAERCRSANRGGQSPGDRGYFLGIRLARTLPDLGDNDLDEVFEDGDGNGTPGDNPCSPGQKLYCDDNCPGTTNEDQADFDSDGVGDACDDSDGDSHYDAADCEPTDPNVHPNASETCNEEDDDCDGTLDEDWPDKGIACTAGTGECETWGVMICTGDGSGIECGAEPGPAGIETCNGKDDDCDGETDELSDNGDGTATDPCTGFVWQNPPYDGYKQWGDAKTYCTNNDAGLSGTNWRLPNISELRSLIRGCPNTVTGGACGVTDVCPECGVVQSCLSWDPCHDDCSYCPGSEGPANGSYWPDEMEGPNDAGYWSSSPVEDVGDVAFAVGFSYGYVNSFSFSSDFHVRCVR